MSTNLIYDDIRFTRYRMSCGNLSAALRSALEARMASLERQLVLLQDAGSAFSADASIAWALPPYFPPK